MQEKIRLLMEETDCEQGEAELALELAGQDLEKAIRTIESLLRHISAIKGKFYFPAKNLYGLLLIVLNTKTRQILRLRTVVSYNPTLYETSPETDWYVLEKLIFSYRLDEGSLPEFTQEIEPKLQEYLLANHDTLVNRDIPDITALVTNFFAPDNVIVAMGREELNLAQFRQLPGTETSGAGRSPASDRDVGMVYLAITCEEDANGKEAASLSEGDIVVSQVTDTRDIAHYLTHLIGGQNNGQMAALHAPVKKLAKGETESEIQVYYAPGIMGMARLANNFKVKVVDTKTESWWRKIIPWS